MKFMRRTAGDSSLDRRRNEDVLEELKVDTVVSVGWETPDTHNISLTIDLSEEEEDLTIFKETTGWMQS
jgi:hypothetical protein